MQSCCHVAKLARLQVRSVNQYTSLLNTEKAQLFFRKVPTSLSHARSEQGSPKDISYWQNIADLSARFSIQNDELLQLKSLLKDEDASLRSIAEEDCRALEEEIDLLSFQLVDAILPPSELDVLSKCQIEINAGVGGTEAMLFASELLGMYEKLAVTCNWKWSPLHIDTTALGGLRRALIALSGPNVYRDMRFEAGVHRVQRVPLTDKSRIHTSTASVSVLPEPEQVELYVGSDEVKIEAMRASGPGGQNVNKRSTAVRVTHKATGISVHCMDERFQHLNLQIAYRKLAAILMQRKIDELCEKRTTARRLQVGSMARAEKVRTYNFKDDRVTDHRIKISVSGVVDFMHAGPSLLDFIKSLNDAYKLDRLNEVMS